MTRSWISELPGPKLRSVRAYSCASLDPLLARFHQPPLPAISTSDGPSTQHEQREISWILPKDYVAATQRQIIKRQGRYCQTPKYHPFFCSLPYSCPAHTNALYHAGPSATDTDIHLSARPNNWNPTAAPSRRSPTLAPRPLPHTGTHTHTHRHTYTHKQAAQCCYSETSWQ